MARLRDRNRNRDLHPRLQVVVEVERPRLVVASDGTVTREGGRLLVLDAEAVTDASANMSLTRPCDASFSVANPSDGWFNSARKLAHLTQRQKEVSDYLLQALQVSTVAERNAARRESFWQRVREGRVTRAALEQATRFGAQSEAGRFTRGGPPATRLDAYSLYEYFSPELDLMNRVWINFADRDNSPDEPSLVAGFSGYISSISRARSPGSHGTVTVACRGLLAMMQRSEVVISAATFGQEFEPLSGEDVRLTDFQPTTNNLAGLGGVEIIERCLRRTRDSFCYNSGTPEEVSRKNPDDYFQQDKLWQLSGDRFPAPDGPALADNVGYGADDEAADPARAFVEGETTTERLNGKLVVDPDIVEAGRFQIFEQQIKSSFVVYQNTAQMAYNLCREVADCVGFDFFEDPRGNVVFQAPKYDLLPRLRGARGIVGLELKADGSPRFGEDYSRVPFHERDYILDSVGDTGLRELGGEDGNVTYVLATSTPNWYKAEDGAIRMLQMTGATSPALLLKEFGELTPTPFGLPRFVCEQAESVRRLTRRLGVRRHNLRPLVMGMSATNFLTRYAYQQMVRINAGTSTAVANLNQRPDIWPGRTVLLVESQKLAYVVGTSNAFNRSARGNHQTTLTLAYVHHPNERIGVPWFLATESPQARATATEENALWKNVNEELAALATLPIP